VTGRKPNPHGKRSNAVIEKLLLLMQQHNLTYTQVSRRLDDLGHPISPTAIRRVIQQERQITVDDAEHLGQVFGLSIIEMVDVEPNQNYRSDVLRWLLAETEYLESVR
jgi:transcriptional regulator with XRE-family HTH domain